MAIAREFATFSEALPAIHRDERLDPAEVTFDDYAAIVARYLTTH